MVAKYIFHIVGALLHQKRQPAGRSAAPDGPPLARRLRLDSGLSGALNERLLRADFVEKLLLDRRRSG